jgi:S-adenosylmethionine synthetase
MININARKYYDDSGEICERKGLGHPDTICDLIAENLSLNLSRHYLENFGFILHHNVDKILLAGGKSEPEFGGGRSIEPIRLFLAGRATAEYKGKKIPVEEIIFESIESLLKQKFQHLTMDNFEIHNSIRQGSVDLVELFERGIQTGEFLSNDSSSGVGYAPLSDLEKIVLDTELFLNSPGIKKTCPETGEDIKIMGVRQNNVITLTAGIAFVDKHIQSIDDYSAKKDTIEKIIVERNNRPDIDLSIKVNTGDDLKNNSIFMTVTGTSAEAGDDGEVGRGNRPNGLISPYRPMTMEAIAGKNPVTHVGKLYNYIAMKISGEIAELDEVKRCYCYLVSRIGHPVSEPFYIDIQLLTADGTLSEKNKKLLYEMVNENLLSLKTFGVDLVKQGKLLAF